MAAQLLRSSRINLLQDQIFVKSAGSENKFDWHRDISYAPIQGKMIISFWMATENVSLHDGGLQFIKGSHRWIENRGSPLKSFPRARKTLLPLLKLLPQYWERVSVRTSEDSDIYSKDDVVSFDLKQGDLLAFHGETQHRAGPNWGNKIDRKGYAVRYVGDDITYHPRPDSGIAYQLWNAKLKMGDKIGGPLFPLLYENGEYLELGPVGFEKGRMWRVLYNQILALRS